MEKTRTLEVYLLVLSLCANALCYSTGNPKPETEVRSSSTSTVNLSPNSDFSVNNSVDNSVNHHPHRDYLVLKLYRKCIENDTVACLKYKVLVYVLQLLNKDNYEVFDGVRVVKTSVARSLDNGYETSDVITKEENVPLYLFQRVKNYIASHSVIFEVPRFVRNLFQSSGDARFFIKAPKVLGRNTFLTGFGLGFLAFGLKKLLLPFFIGLQVVKSLALALFLPTLLGGVTKYLATKGVQVASSSSMDDFNTGFKDNFDTSYDSLNNLRYPENRLETAASDAYGVGYPATGMSRTPLMSGPVPVFVPAAPVTRVQQPMHVASPKVSSVNSIYTGPSLGADGVRPADEKLNSKQDFKIFHNIPSSSMLLTTYDPFYSPLLSRIDSVFKQLGYDTEVCREKLVCSMYKTPAKFAPFSNLISAQLSRELNELRKPYSDNPEILRFFRYMKAAKDGQDGRDCNQVYAGCELKPNLPNSPPMVKTYNEINKLVLARRFGRHLDITNTTNPIEQTMTLNTNVTNNNTMTQNNETVAHKRH